MSNAYSYLTPEEINAYQTRIQQADTAYGRGRSNIDYLRSIAGQDYGLGKTKMTRSWDQSFRGLPSSYARRGVMRSGIYNRGFRDYTTQREQAFSDLGLANQRQMDQYQRQQDDLELIRNMTVQQIEAERAARNASLAATLRGLQ